VGAIALFVSVAVVATVGVVAWYWLESPVPAPVAIAEAPAATKKAGKPNPAPRIEEPPPVEKQPDSPPPPLPKVEDPPPEKQPEKPAPVPEPPPVPPEKKEEKPAPPAKVPEKKDPKPPPPEVPPIVPKVGPKEKALTDKLLRQLNTYRKTAGLEVVQLDPELSRGCSAHARYIALHPPKGGQGLLDEVPGQKGYSEEGKRAAAVAMVSVGGDPGVVIERGMGRLQDRVLFLKPDLRGVGIGAAPLAGGSWAVVFDLMRGSEAPVVLYPAPGEEDVPLSFAGGPEVAEMNGIAGFPVTAMFPPLRKVTDAKAELHVDATGKAVDAWLSTPEKPAVPQGQRNTIGLLPKAALESSTVYRVRMSASVDSKRWSKDWTFTTEDDSDKNGVLAKKALDRVNRYRAEAGLTPVTLDAELSRGCAAHARYLSLNLGHPATAGLGAHNEDLKLPGASELGRKAGLASDINIGDPNPLLGVDNWMATLYHRVPILEPTLKTVGYGCARGKQMGWITVLNVHSGRGPGLRPRDVYYPAPDQRDVPLHFPIGGEIPNPIPEDKTGRAGYPITAFFPQDNPLTSASAILTDSTGRELPVWFSSAEHPANGQFVKNQGNTVCLIAKEPFKPNAIYRVQLRGQRRGTGFEHAWQFTTGSAGPTVAQATAQIFKRLNFYRAAAGLSAVQVDTGLSRGCQAHAEYLVRNAQVLDKKNGSMNDEDPKLPGYTPEGQLTARQSNVFSNSPDPVAQVEDLMGTLLRRGYLLDPQLTRVGVGCAHDVGRGWRCVLDLVGGRGSGQVVLYPAPDQEGVPTAAGEVVPGKKTPLGFPISVLFPPMLKILGGKGTLTDANGKTIDTLLVTPERPLDPARPVQSAVCLYPRVPLRRGQTYSVTLSAVVNGQQWQRSWQFATE
jgi:uncharacterized protein YkwD